MRINDLLALSHVPRWSIISTSKEQTVSDHTFRVLCIATELGRRTGVILQVEDLMQILHHDAHESWTADIPSPVKNEMEAGGYDFLRCVPWMKREAGWSSPDAKMLLKLADRIEAFTYIEKWGVGRQAEEVATGCRASFDEIFREYPNWRNATEDLLRDVMFERERRAAYRS